MAPNRQSIASVIRSLSFEDLFVADAKYPTLTSSSSPPAKAPQPQRQEERGSSSDTSLPKAPSSQRHGISNDTVSGPSEERTKKRSSIKGRTEEAACKAAARREEAVGHAEAFFAWPGARLGSEIGEAAERRRKEDAKERAKEWAEEAVSGSTIEAILAKDTAAASSSSETRRRGREAPDADFDYWNWESSVGRVEETLPHTSDMSCYPELPINPREERLAAAAAAEDEIPVDAEGGGAGQSSPKAHQYKEEEKKEDSEEYLLLRYAENAGCPVGTDHGYHHGCFYGEVYDSWEEGMEGTQAERDGYWYM